MLCIAGGGTGSGEQEAEVGGSLGQRDRQTPQETHAFQKRGHRAAHSQCQGWMGEWKELGLGKEESSS